MVALALAVGLTTSATGSARQLSLSGRFFRITWGEFNIATEGGSSTRCPATLEGSFHTATFAKAINSLIGYVTRGAVGSCSTGTVRFLVSQAAPWHIQYEGFEGALPAITRLFVKYIGAAIEWSRFGFGCLYTSEAGRPMRMGFTRGTTLGEFQGTSPGTGSIPPAPGILCSESISLAAGNPGVVKDFSTEGALYLHLI